MDEITKSIQNVRASRIEHMQKCFSNLKEIENGDYFVEKAEDEEELEKARGGIYKNTVKNQKLGRVGQKYGKEGQKDDFTDFINKNTAKIKECLDKKPSERKAAFQDKFGDSVTFDNVAMGSGGVGQSKNIHGKAYVQISYGKGKYNYADVAIFDFKQKNKEEKNQESETKKSDEDELNVEEDSIKKSDIMESLYSDNIKFQKTGKEIKAQVDSVLLPELNSKLSDLQNQADQKLSECGKAPTEEPDYYWLKSTGINIGYKVYKWRETSFSEDSSNRLYPTLSAGDAEEKKGNCATSVAEAASRNDYNELVRKIYGVEIDIKACEILKQMNDNLKYQLTARQLLAFKF